MLDKKSAFWLVFLLFFPIIVVGQATSSPYSSRGIGLWENSSNGVFGGMAGTRISIVDSTYSNSYNPASYSYLGKGLPLFSFDFTTKFSFYTSQTNKDKANATYIKNINIAIPFAKRFGLAFGLKPVLKRGYRFSNLDYVGSDSVRYTYIGSGQVQQVYLAFSVAPIKTKKHFFSLGINGGYNFGTLKKTRVVEFFNNPELFNASSENGIRVSSLGLKAGFQYRYKVSETSAFSVGGIYQPGLKWKATKTDFLYRFGGQYGIDNPPGSTDTLYYVGDNKGSISVPQRIGAGFTWELKGREDSLQRGTLVYRLRLSLDYEFVSWSKYALNFANNTDTTKLSNASFYRFGLDFTPHQYFNDSRPNVKYFSKINYRLGFRYGLIPSPINSTQTKNMALSFGMGFPIPIFRSVSSFNFGVTLGQQGVVGAQSIREQYIGVHIGVVISPGNDRWFRKYKYD